MLPTISRSAGARPRSDSRIIESKGAVIMGFGALVSFTLARLKVVAKR
jgi:hypothetical protein